MALALMYTNVLQTAQIARANQEAITAFEAKLNVASSTIKQTFSPTEGFNVRFRLTLPRFFIDRQSSLQEAVIEVCKDLLMQPDRTDYTNIFESAMVRITSFVQPTCFDTLSQEYIEANQVQLKATGYLTDHKTKLVSWLRRNANGAKGNVYKNVSNVEVDRARENMNSEY